jgi:hypothetical protein
MNKDILLIVYRHLHNYYYKQLKNDYYILFQKFFDNEQHWFLLRNENGLPWGWCCDRMLDSSFPSDGYDICTLHTKGKRCAKRLIGKKFKECFVTRV